MPVDRAIVDEYKEWIMTRINVGFEPYLMTFMFNAMGGGERSSAKRMAKVVEETYSKLLIRIERRPRKRPTIELPMLLCAPDWPVPKHLKSLLNDVTINGGLHWHGVFLLPPTTRKPISLNIIVHDKQSVFAGPNRPLARLHAVPIERTAMKAVGYALKQVERGRVGHGHLLIYPRVDSEMPDR